MTVRVGLDHTTLEAIFHMSGSEAQIRPLRHMIEQRAIEICVPANVAQIVIRQAAPEYVNRLIEFFDSVRAFRPMGLRGILWANQFPDSVDPFDLETAASLREGSCDLLATFKPDRWAWLDNHIGVRTPTELPTDELVTGEAVGPKLFPGR